MGFGSQKSESKAVGPEQLLLPAQKQALNVAIPSLLDKALQSGFSPAEKSRLFARSTENINEAVRSGGQGVRRSLATSGIRGGAAGQEFSNIAEAGIRAKGAAGTSLEALDRQEADARIKRLLGAAGIAPVGSSSKSSGFNVDTGIRFGP